MRYELLFEIVREVWEVGYIQSMTLWRYNRTSYIKHSLDAVELFHGPHRDEVMPNDRSLLRVIDKQNGRW